MMANHHRDRGSAGAAVPGCGGFFFLLILVAVLAKYLWVFVLIAAVVLVAYAIWATYRTSEPPPSRPLPRDPRAGQLGSATPPRQIPAKAPKPKPNKRPAPTGDALTAQLRSDRRRRRELAMEDWDGEWGRLLGSAPESQPKASRGSRRRQSATTPSSIDVGSPVVVVKRIPANVDYPAQAEPGDVGTVTQVGKPSSAPGLRCINVKLDRTGQIVTILEKSLAPRRPWTGHRQRGEAS